MGLAEELKRIKDVKLDVELLKRQNDVLCQENNIKIEGLQDIVKSTEANLEEMLTKSGEKKIECKIGYCSFRTMPDKWEYIDSEIVDWCKHKNMPYFHTVEIVEKINIKKAILDNVLNLKDVPGITVTPQEPKFGYKIK